MVPPDSKKLILEVRRQNVPIKGLVVSSGEMLIGRVVGNDGLQLDGVNVAPRQAKVVSQNDYLMLYALDERHPVLVNGKRVTSTILNLGDSIRIGEYEIVLVNDDPPDSTRLAALRGKVHEDLVIRFNENLLELKLLSPAALAQRCSANLDELLANRYLPPNTPVQQIKQELLDEVLGLGPLEALLKDETITEIMVNSADRLFVEKSGRLTRIPFLSSDEEIMNIIARIVNPIGRRIDESSPMVDARLSDGSRVNAIIPPLSIQGPMLTIRKFSKKKYVSEDLIRFGTVTPEIVSFLDFAVRARMNIVISGGTGSGKTTLLNVLSNFIPHDERVLTIEDSAELQLTHDNLGSLEARPPNIESKGAVTIRDLVKNSLRMRPDRIVVGECRGGEALDMLQAMNTGHDGSLTTLHANNPEDAILRLETMVLMAGYELPIQAIRRQIASAVNVIVQQTRMRDGTRKIVRVCEVLGMDQSEVVMKDIFKFKQRTISSEGKVVGDFLACGYVPKFVKEHNEIGEPFDEKIFQLTA